MQDSLGDWFLYNSTVFPSEELDGLCLQDEEVVYEVIRMIDGVPLFLEDHYERMSNSLELIGSGLKTSSEDLKLKMAKVVQSNGKKDCNIKIIAYNKNSVQNLVLYVSTSYYPGQKEIHEGVPVCLFNWERENPNAKLVNQEYKDTVSLFIKHNNAFEALLVNDSDNITEGSKSNVFFIKGDKAFTAPDRYVLKGVTRKYIYEAFNTVGVSVIETLVNVRELAEFEGVFISGTSIKVLPVAGIDSYRYESGTNRIIVAIRDQYDKILDQYIMIHK